MRGSPEGIRDTRVQYVQRHTGRAGLEEKYMEGAIAIVVIVALVLIFADNIS